MLSFFPRGVLDEILNLIGSVSEGFPSYSCLANLDRVCSNGGPGVQNGPAAGVLGSRKRSALCAGRHKNLANFLQNYSKPLNSIISGRNL